MLLFIPNQVDTSLHAGLLFNITPRLTEAQREFMDSPNTLAELTMSVRQLRLQKSPGMDGIPIEFYQQF